MSLKLGSHCSPPYCGEQYCGELLDNGIGLCYTINMFVNAKGERIHTRATTDPEPFHLDIYRALGLPLRPLANKRSRT